MIQKVSITAVAKCRIRTFQLCITHTSSFTVCIVAASITPCCQRMHALHPQEKVIKYFKKLGSNGLFAPFFRVCKGSPRPGPFWPIFQVGDNKIILEIPQIQNIMRNNMFSETSYHRKFPFWVKTYLIWERGVEGGKPKG